MIGIYILRNNKKNKCYIGQSINVEARFKSHLYNKNYSFYQNKELYADLHDEPTAFDFSILCTCNESDLNDLEEYYIEKYDSIEHGYNRRRGGHGNHRQSEQTRRKISDGMRAAAFKKHNQHYEIKDKLS